MLYFFEFLDYFCFYQTLYKIFLFFFIKKPIQLLFAYFGCSTFIVFWFGFWYLLRFLCLHSTKHWHLIFLCDFVGRRWAILEFFKYFFQIFFVFGLLVFVLMWMKFGCGYNLCIIEVVFGVSKMDGVGLELMTILSEHFGWRWGKAIDERLLLVLAKIEKIHDCLILEFIGLVHVAG